MIKILKGQSNDVVLTLSEKVTIDPVSFLFEFVHQMSGEIKIFSASDISVATLRYNEFTIIETSTEDLYDGRVELQEGFHKYTIYEMTPASPADLNPANAIGVVELGKVFVPAENEVDITYYDNTFVKDIPSYK